MMYGKASNGEKIKAVPGNSTAVCPLCNTELVKKCGSIKIWHWAHKSVTDCDPWAEPESDWHLEWKRTFEQRGFVIEKIIGKHRADCVNETERVVVELQNSSISNEEIAERTDFYRTNGYKMVWIFNAADWKIDLRLKECDIFTFRWKYPHRSLMSLFNPSVTCRAVIFDLGNEEWLRLIGTTHHMFEGMECPSFLFDVRKCYLDEDCVGGWGKFMELNEGGWKHA